MIGRKIYIVQGEHPSVLGTRIAAHATRASAVRAATEWTNDYLRSRRREPTATPRNWRSFWRPERGGGMYIDEVVIEA